MYDEHPLAGRDIQYPVNNTYNTYFSSAVLGLNLIIAENMDED